jgi:hypothetical protein
MVLKMFATPVLIIRIFIKVFFREVKKETNGNRVKYFGVMVVSK